MKMAQSKNLFVLDGRTLYKAPVDPKCAEYWKNLLSHVCCGDGRYVQVYDVPPAHDPYYGPYQVKEISAVELVTLLINQMPGNVPVCQNVDGVQYSIEKFQGSIRWGFTVSHIRDQLLRDIFGDIYGNSSLIENFGSRLKRKGGNAHFSNNELKQYDDPVKLLQDWQMQSVNGTIPNLWSAVVDAELVSVANKLGEWIMTGTVSE